MTDTQAPATSTAHFTVRCQFCDTWNRIDAARTPDRPKCGKCAKPILLDRPLALNDETFARTIAETDVPVLVDFYADWCGPCKTMAPFVDEVAREQQGSVLVAKLDTDRAQQTAAHVHHPQHPDDDRVSRRQGSRALHRRHAEARPGRAPRHPVIGRENRRRYSCAGSGSIVSGSTGTCTSSR